MNWTLNAVVTEMFDRAGDAVLELLREAGFTAEQLGSIEASNRAP